ncbi:PIN domain-containing protein [Deinococcus sp. UYEF24]
MTPPIVLYDASVLYPSLIRNLLMHLAVGGLVSARWTVQIHDEWTRNLLADRADLTPERLARTRRFMDQAVPDALVGGYEDLILGLDLPDADDRHVLAAAITARAEMIVTFNLKHFPVAALEPRHLQALTPDLLLCRLLDHDAQATETVLESLRRSLRHPAYTPQALLACLEQVGLPVHHPR